MRRAPRDRAPPRPDRRRRATPTAAPVGGQRRDALPEPERAELPGDARPAVGAAAARQIPRDQGLAELVADSAEALAGGFELGARGRLAEIELGAADAAPGVGEPH